MITFEPVRRALAERLPLGLPAARSAAGRATPARRSLRRCGVLGAAIVLVPLAGYLGTAALMALVIATAEAAPFSLSAALAAALPGWLALHQVPLTISGAPLSTFPLVPTGLVVLLIAVSSSRAAERAQLTRPDQARWVVLSMALAHGLVGLVLALHLRGAVAADPMRAFLYCGLTALVAATLGVAGRCGLIQLVRAQAGAEICAGARIGASAVVGAAGIGALLVLLSLLSSLPEIGGVLAAAGSPGDAFGLMLLSLMYLPNAVLAAWSFAAGSGLSIGALELSPFGMTTGDLPAVPLFAVLPSGSGAWWWALVLVLPPLLGARMGRSCLRVPLSPRRTWWVFAVAVGLAAPGVGLLAGLAGGRLGGALFDPVTLRPGLLAATTFGWLAIPAAVALWWLRRRGEPVGAPPVQDEVGVSPGEFSEVGTREVGTGAAATAPGGASGESDAGVAESRQRAVDEEAAAPDADDGSGSPEVDDEPAGVPEDAADAGTARGDHPAAESDEDQGDHLGTGTRAVESEAPAEMRAGDEPVDGPGAGGTDQGGGGNEPEAPDSADGQGGEARDAPGNARPR